jgi:hypothetical protein
MGAVLPAVALYILVSVFSEGLESSLSSPKDSRAIGDGDGANKNAMVYFGTK